MIINIGSTATPDLPVAQALASKFNGRIVWGFVDLTSITEDIIIVGGQMANQNYNWLVQQGYVPALRSQTTGFGSIFYLKLSNHNIWVTTGWSVEDTAAAAHYAINMGLPKVSRVIPLLANKEAIQIHFPYASPSGMSLLSSKISDVLLNVTNKIPGTGIIDSWVDKQGKNLFLLREKSELKLVVIADDVIIALIIAIAVIVGLIILGVIFTVTIHEYNVTKRADMRSGTVEDILTNPNLSSEEKIAAVKAYYQGEAKVMKQEGDNIFQVIKWAVILAGLGIGTYYTTKGIMALKKGGKKK